MLGWCAFDVCSTPCSARAMRGGCELKRSAGLQGKRAMPQAERMERMMMNFQDKRPGKLAVVDKDNANLAYQFCMETSWK